MSGGDTLVDLPLLSLLAGSFEGDLVALFPAWRFVVAYLLAAAILFAAPLFTRPAVESP